MNYNKAYQLSETIAKNEYNISSSRPLTDIREKKEILITYKPTNEERRFTRMIALERLERWEQDLTLGGCDR